MANRHSEQAGLEVVSVQPAEKIIQQVEHTTHDAAYSSPIPVAAEQQLPQANAQYNPHPPIDPRYAQYNQQGYPGGGGAGGGYGGNPQFNGSGPAPEFIPERRICGLKRSLFITLAVVIGIIIAAAVGGGVGGALASKNNKSSGSSSDSQTTTSAPSTSTTGAPTSTTSAGPQYATPGTFAAVKSSTSGEDDYNSISYLFQDINTPDIYLWTIIKGQDWVEIGKIEGLDPPPKANSSFGAIQAPDSDTISIYYAADNGTLFDASGSSTGTNWQNGVMARRTNYGILVSEGSGIAATWWGLKGQNGPGYSSRVYYVDSAAARIRELAFDNNKNPQWFVTNQEFETCSPTAKIGLAHLPPNATSSDRETVHLFYQTTVGDLRHYPGYDGAWDIENAETISQSTVPDNAYLASSIYTDESTNCTLHVWFLDASARLSVLTGQGQSTRTHPTFENIGTFSQRNLVTGFTSSYISDGQIPGGSLAAVGWVENEEQVRVYFRANLAKNQNEDGAVEIAGTNGWASKVLPELLLGV
ncbi:hypothetical protein TWF694_010068 [Orbilia ellipsospora]|uniref:Fucose-specific lectin n=1 Tax=Orbilia ellipsospora TaxID=2528407 RepID=A0AAV9X9Y8_9PEZI